MPPKRNKNKSNKKTNSSQNLPAAKEIEQVVPGAESATNIEIEEQKYEEAFKMIDKDQNNKITKAEFTNILDRYHLGNAWTKDTTDLIFSGMDKDGNGFISITEFTRASKSEMINKDLDVIVDAIRHEKWQEKRIEEEENEEEKKEDHEIEKKIRHEKDFENKINKFKTLGLDRYATQELGMTQRKYEKYRHVFEMIDSNSSGNINKKELNDVLDKYGLGLKLTKSDVEDFFKHLDLNHDGEINLQEFLESLNKQQTNRQVMGIIDGIHEEVKKNQEDSKIKLNVKTGKDQNSNLSSKTSSGNNSPTKRSPNQIKTKSASKILGDNTKEKENLNESLKKIRPYTEKEYYDVYFEIDFSEKKYFTKEDYQKTLEIQKKGDEYLEEMIEVFEACIKNGKKGVDFGLFMDIIDKNEKKLFIECVNLKVEEGRAAKRFEDGSPENSSPTNIIENKKTSEETIPEGQPEVKRAIVFESEIGTNSEHENNTGLTVESRRDPKSESPKTSSQETSEQDNLIDFLKSWNKVVDDHLEEVLSEDNAKGYITSLQNLMAHVTTKDKGHDVVLNLINTLCRREDTIHRQILELKIFHDEELNNKIADNKNFGITIQNLEQQIRQFENQNENLEELRRENSHLKGVELLNLKLESQNWKNQYDETSKQAELKSQEIIKLQEIITDHETKNLDIQKRLNELENQNMQQEEKNESQRLNFAQLEEHRRKLLDDLTTLKAEKSTVDEDLQNKNAEFEDFKRKNNELLIDIESLKNKIIDLESQKMQMHSNDEFNKLSMEIEDKKRIQIELEDNLTTTKSQVENLEGQIKVSRDQIEKLEDTNNDLELKINKFEVSLITAKETVSELEKAKNILEEERIGLNKNLIHIKESSDKIINEKEEAALTSNDEKERLKRENSTLEDRIKALIETNNVQEETQKQLTTLREENLQLKNEITDLEQALKNVQKEVESLNVTKDNLETLISNLETEKLNLISRGEYEDLTKKYQELENLNASLKSEFEKQKVNTFALGEKEENINNLIKTLEEQIKEKDQEMAVVKEEYESLKLKHQELTGVVDCLKGDLETQKNNSLASEAKEEEMRKQVKIFEERIDAKDQEISASKEEINKAISEIDNLKNEKSNAEKNLLEAESKYNSLVEEKTRIEAENTHLLDQIKKLKLDHTQRETLLDKELKENIELLNEKTQALAINEKVHEQLVCDKNEIQGRLDVITQEKEAANEYVQELVTKNNLLAMDIDKLKANQEQLRVELEKHQEESSHVNLRNLERNTTITERGEEEEEEDENANTSVTASLNQADKIKSLEATIARLEDNIRIEKEHVAVVKEEKGKLETENGRLLQRLDKIRGSPRQQIREGSIIEGQEINNLESSNIENDEEKEALKKQLEESRIQKIDLLNIIESLNQNMPKLEMIKNERMNELTNMIQLLIKQYEDLVKSCEDETFNINKKDIKIIVGVNIETLQKLFENLSDIAQIIKSSKASQTPVSSIKKGISPDRLDTSNNQTIENMLAGSEKSARVEKRRFSTHSARISSTHLLGERKMDTINEVKAFSLNDSPEKNKEFDQEDYFRNSPEKRRLQTYSLEFLRYLNEQLIQYLQSVQIEGKRPEDDERKNMDEKENKLEEFICYLSRAGLDSMINVMDENNELKKTINKSKLTINEEVDTSDQDKDSMEGSDCSQNSDKKRDIQQNYSQDKSQSVFASVPDQQEPRELNIQLSLGSLQNTTPRVGTSSSPLGSSGLKKSKPVFNVKEEEAKKTYERLIKEGLNKTREIEDLTKKLSETQRNLDILENDFKSTNEKLQKLEQVHNEEKTKISDELNNVVETSRNHIDDITNERDRLLQEKSLVMQEKENLKTKTLELESSIKILEEKLSNSNGELEQANKLYEAEKKRLYEENKSIRDQESKAKSLNVDHENTLIRLKELQQENEKLEQQNKLNISENELIQKENGKFKEQIRVFEGEIADLTKKKEKLNEVENDQSLKKDDSGIMKELTNVINFIEGGNVQIETILKELIYKLAQRLEATNQRQIVEIDNVIKQKIQGLTNYSSSYQSPLRKNISESISIHGNVSGLSKNPFEGEDDQNKKSHKIGYQVLFWLGEDWKITHKYLSVCSDKTKRDLKNTLNTIKTQIYELNDAAKAYEKEESSKSLSNWEGRYTRISQDINACFNAHRQLKSIQDKIHQDLRMVSASRIEA